MSNLTNTQTVQYGTNIPVVNTVQALRVLNNYQDYMTVIVLGNLSFADGNGGIYTFDSTATLSDDGINTIQPAFIPVGSPGRYILTNLNSSADGLVAALKAQYASSTGAELIGYGDTTVASALDNIVSQKIVYSVDTFGCVDDGVFDNATIITNMITSLPEGSMVFVPHSTKGEYYMSTNPWATVTAKSLNWQIADDVVFTGPGADAVDSFMRLKTNGWLIPVGPYNFKASDNGAIGNPPGGAISYNTIEVEGDNLSDASVTGTATITSGSNTLTSVPASTFTGLVTGMVVSSTAPGFPTPATSGNNGGTVYVKSFDSTNGIIELSTISGNSVIDYVYSGTTGSYSFTFTAMKWEVAQYIGTLSGTNASPYMGMTGTNYVMNIEAGYTGFTDGIEVDINNNSGGTTTGGYGLILTGNGDTDVNTAIRIERSNNNWLKGMNLANVTDGIHLNFLRYGIIFDDIYRDESGGTATPAACLTTYYNPIAANNSFIQATQFLSGTPMIQLFRKADATTGGRYIQCKDQTGANELFFVTESGNIGCYGNSSGFNSTCNAGGMTIPGITLQPGSNLQLGQEALTGTVTATNTLTIYDSNGKGWKINVAAA